MTYRLLADLVVVAHFGFILFVVLGGLLVIRWPKLMWAHLPAALWGAIVELSGWICPLTPLESRLRILGGGREVTDSFIAHYLLPVIYPQGLTRTVQMRPMDSMAFPQITHSLAGMAMFKKFSRMDFGILFECLLINVFAS